MSAKILKRTENDAEVQVEGKQTVLQKAALIERVPVKILPDGSV